MIYQIKLMFLERALIMENILCIDIPVQMISCTDTDGKITPLRFRFRDNNGEIITITIEKNCLQIRTGTVWASTFPAHPPSTAHRKNLPCGTAILPMSGICRGYIPKSSMQPNNSPSMEQILSRARAVWSVNTMQRE